MKKRRAGKKSQGRTRAVKPAAFAPRPVTAAELRALKRELERRIQPAGLVRPRRGTAASRSRRPKASAMRWNPDPEDVQRSVAQLVLTLVEFLRKLMERQAVRRMEEKTLTKKEMEAVGVGLMKLEETIHQIGKRFGLTPEDLNLDLGTLKLM